MAISGSAFSPDELIAALKAWDDAAKNPDRSFASYRSFATAVRGEWAPTGRRLPTGLTPFHRVFGSWSAALSAASVTLLDDQKQRGVRSRGSRTEYTNERIVGWLKAAAESLDVRRVGMNAYDAWAKERCREALDRGSVMSIARSNTICTRYGSWGPALLAAGLIGQDEAEHVSPRSERVDEVSVLEALGRAIRARGRDEGRVLTMTDYKLWRADQPDVDGRRTGRRVPDASLIRTRFGRWNRAICAALDSDPELARMFTTRPKEWSHRWRTT